MVPRGKALRHLLYKTTNTLTGEYYIGVHSTLDENDGYLGSGKALTRLIKAYGRQNFTRDVLTEFPDRESLLEGERDLVTEEVLKDPLCLNLVCGGSGVVSLDDRPQSKLQGRVKATKDGKAGYFLEPIPEGWSKWAPQDWKGYTWVNNGTTQYRVKQGELQGYLDSGWATGRVKGTSGRRRHLSDELVLGVQNAYLSGVRMKDIAQEFGVSMSWVSNQIKKLPQELTAPIKHENMASREFTPEHRAKLSAAAKKQNARGKS